MTGLVPRFVAPVCSRSAGWIAVLAVVIVAGCALLQPAPRTPVTFTGTLACGDCPALAQRLTLNPDGSYWFEAAQAGAPEGATPQREVGRYALDHRRLTLAGEGLVPRDWALRDGALVPLARADEAPPADGPALAALAAPVAEFGPLRVRGQVWRAGEALVFEACATGLRHPVTGGEGLAALSLEQARVAPRGGRVLAAIEARFHRVAAGPTAVEVVAFERAVAGAFCDGRPPESAR